jgi:hypothetical protein
MPQEYIPLSEAVELLVKKGMSRKKAQEAIMKGLQDGKIRSTARAVIRDGKLIAENVQVPTEWWKTK